MNSVNLRGGYAGFVTRAAAFIIDVVIISVSIGAINWLVRLLMMLLGIDITNCPSIGWDLDIRPELCAITRWVMVAISLAFPFVYLLFFWTLSGQTPGKFLVRVRIITADGKRI